MSLKAYNSYKKTNFEWLDEVPDHWDNKKIAWDLPYVVGWTPPSGKDEFYGGEHPWVTIADMTRGQIEDTHSKITEAAIDAKKADIVPAGSMLFSFKLSVGKVAFLKIDSYTNEAIAAFRPTRGICLEYWKFAAPEIIPHYGRENIYGAKLLNQELIGSTRFCCPPVSEQTQIARFLDHETAKIDALIREQERLIELLQEKRQAVISHAVTKGLDPHVPMKDSGVEWLGEVPQHWEVTRLKFISMIVDCKNRTPEYFDDGEYLVVRTSNVRDQSLKMQGAHYTDEENYRIWTQRGVPPEGSILFTREAPAGEVCIVPSGVPLCLGQRMMNFIPNEPRHTSFIFDFLTSDCLVRYMESVAHGSTVSHLRVEQVYDIPLVIPPFEEQEAIDHKVSVLKAQFRGLICESEKAVGLLSERRTSLISAAVTGKIDVRDWQPPADESAFDEEVRQAGLEATA